jgi:hypothetical protein
LLKQVWLQDGSEAIPVTVVVEDVDVVVVVVVVVTSPDDVVWELWEVELAELDMLTELHSPNSGWLYPS